MEKVKVKIQVVSERGHDTLLLEPTQALERIKEETGQKGKWCYMDGNFKKADTITQADIQSADNITLTTALGGG